MTKIPTAKEILTMEFSNSGTGIHFGVINVEGENMYPEIIKAMKEFAKLHVQAAIQECIESAPTSSTDSISYEEIKYCLEDCYPETNIV